MRRLLLLGGIVLGLALTVAGPAFGKATTYTVWAGEQTFPAPAPAPQSTVLNDFFPRTIKIRKGDRITIKNLGFHVVAYPGNADPASLAFAIPDPANGTYADTPNDFAGQPWYFEGLTKFIYNTFLFLPTPGVVKDKKTFVNSGAALLPADPATPAKFTFTFPKTGSYTLLCVIHPGMELKVKVVGASAARPHSRAAATVPTPAQVTAQGKAQYAASYAEAVPLAQVPVPANTVYAGVGGRTALLAWLPGSISVPAGTTVTFTSMSPSEVHNPLFAQDFGESGWLAGFLQATDLFPGAPGSPNQLSPFFVYGSDPVAADGAYAYSGTNHGNGVLATPLIDDNPASPFAQSVRVKFTAPGTYHYICQLHGPDMSGDVIVTAVAG